MLEKHFEVFSVPQDLMDIAPIGCVIAQGEKIVFVNRMALNVLKAEDDSELLGHSLYDFINPNYHSLSRERVSQPEPGKILPLVRMDLCCLNEETAFVEVSSKHIFYQGKLSTMVLFLDVTQQVKKEETAQRVARQLAESEAKYQIITENMTDLIVVLDCEGTITYASPSYKRGVGIDPKNYLGQSGSSLIHPEDIVLSRDAFRKVVETLQPVRFEFRKRTNQNDTYRWFESNVTPYKNKSGHYRFIAVSRDITDRKEAERQLKESEKHYRLIAENTSDIIRVVNPDGIITFASPSHKSVLGFEPEEYVGKSYLYKVHDEDIEIYRSTFAKAIVSRQPFTCEVRRLNDDESYNWVESTGTPVVDKHGNIVEFVIVGRDTTDRKKNQEQLEFLAFHDALTGLPNSRVFRDRVKQAMQQATRSSDFMAILYLDCDKFKNVNDTYGHDVGDEVIREFGRRIVGSVREIDTVCRIGGDEFVVLLPTLADSKDASVVARRILAEMNRPWHCQGHTLELTSSIGIAIYPNHGDDIQSLLKRADEALYWAKQEGRSRDYIWRERVDNHIGAVQAFKN